MPETIRDDLTGDGWKQLPFTPFRGDVTIHWICPFAEDRPGVALLKYPAGASVWSNSGCVVLIQWDRPVTILKEEVA